MQGRLDSALTEKGKRDAQLLRERLKAVHFARVISSPSKRALETAACLIDGRKLSIDTDERLMEIALGDWQGKTADEIKELYPKQYHAYWNEPSIYENASGELFSDVQERAAGFLQSLQEARAKGNILIVTHAVVIKTIYLLCRNSPIEAIWQEPFINGTSLTILNATEGMLQLELEACMAHCAAEEKKLT